MMIAAQMHGIRDVRVAEIPKPAIGAGEILLKVKRAGICGTDLRMIANGFAGIGPESPRTLGHEIAGVIDEVGSEVQGYAEGDRVAVAPNIGCGICGECVKGDYHLCPDYRALGVQLDGGFAEYAVVPEQAVRFGNVAKLPDHVTFDQAALAEPLSCVYNGLLVCPVSLGDDVLVIGAGTIGIMYAQMAKRAGAGRVFLANRSAGRLELAKRIDESFIALAADGLKERILELTGGRGVDVCVTANPSPEAQQLAVEVAAMNGRINFFGGLPKNAVPVGIDTNRIHYKQILATGSTKANNHHFRRTLQFIANGMIDADKLVSNRFPISEFGQAVEAASRSVGIKTLITFD